MAGVKASASSRKFWFWPRGLDKRRFSVWRSLAIWAGFDSALAGVL